MLFFGFRESTAPTHKPPDAGARKQSPPDKIIRIIFTEDLDRCKLHNLSCPQFFLTEMLI
jgi:hypothetical protein